MSEGSKRQAHPSRISLVLMFTRGVSLQRWHEIGMFGREIALYRKLQAQGVDITFVTYGDARDLEFARELPGIRICCNHRGFRDHWYERMLPFLHGRAFRAADLVKTNQAKGGEIAVAAAAIWRKPLIARCGYLWSKNMIIEQGADSALAKQSQAVESRLFHAAARIVVTTEEMRQDIAHRFPALAPKVAIVPNYVNTEIFAPHGRMVNGIPRLCFVGRLAPEKNLEALLAAIAELEVELDIVGQGPLRDRLTALAAGNPRVRFLGRVANEELPGIFANCTAFVFPSLYEGHPKTPIEAMACGLPVIATNVSGIREIIRHGETGWLCDITADALREGICTVLADPALQERLICNALEEVRQTYALDRIVEQELAIYQAVLASRRGCSR